MNGLKKWKPEIISLMIILKISCPDLLTLRCIREDNIVNAQSLQYYTSALIKLLQLCSLGCINRFNKNCNFVIVVTWF